MECPICFENYSGDVSLKRRPQLLPCGHEACESCLQQLHAANNQVIKCPICNSEHRVNPRSLPIVYGMIQDSTTTHKCSTGACSNRAYIICPHCEELFCSGHFKDHQEDIFDICSVNLMQAVEKRQQNKDMNNSVIRLLEASRQKVVRMKRFIQQLQDLCRDLERTVEEQEKLLKTLSEAEAATEVLVNDFTFLVESREDVEKMWTKWQEVEAHPQMLMDVEVPVADVEALNVKLKNLLSTAAPSMTAHVDVETASCLSHPYRCFGEVDRKVVQLTETPVRIVSLKDQPYDVAVVKDTRGFSLQRRFLQSGVVVRGSSGSALPSPSLLVSLHDIHSPKKHDHLLVCHENGQVKGKIQLKYKRPGVQKMAVTDNGNDLIITDFNNKCVMKLSLSGDVITTSKPGVFSYPCDFCCLSDDRVAVCDSMLKLARILSQADLSLIKSLQHPHITDPEAVTTTSSHLIVTNYQYNSRLVFFSLRNFSFVKVGDEELNLPTKLLCYKGNIFISTCDDNKVIQMSESGTPISTVGSAGVGDSQFKTPLGLAIICSSNGDVNLVVADSKNKGLKFYKLCLRSQNNSCT